MRSLYSFILYLLAPCVFLRLLWRGMRAPAYLRRWPERLGFFPREISNAPVWVHAVSVGEAQAAVPLVKALLERHPGIPVVVTTTTPTGSRQVRASLGTDVVNAYVPYDLPDAVGRFLRHVHPRMAVIMETELWPNLFHACQRHKIPLIVANARLSQRSARGYRLVSRLTAQTLRKVSVFAAQSREDAGRLIALGAPAPRVQVTGNLKFDIRLPSSLREQAAALRQEWGGGRPLWIAASTHEREDEQVLEALAIVRRAFPKVLLVLVPRHPERFSRVSVLCRGQGYEIVLRSEQRPCAGDTDIFIGDSMGELTLFYAAADVAFVGGSLTPAGGHNVLEPAALGLPVLFGPHMHNFSEISRLLLDAGAARQVCGTHELAQAVVECLQDDGVRRAMGRAGRQVVERNRGALQKVLDITEAWL